MGNCHPTRLFCHSSTAAGYICYILRAIFRWLHIGGSSPVATVEGARRPVFSHSIASPYKYGRRVRPWPSSSLCYAKYRATRALLPRLVVKRPPAALADRAGLCRHKRQRELRLYRILAKQIPKTTYLAEQRMSTWQMRSSFMHATLLL